MGTTRMSHDEHFDIGYGLYGCVGLRPARRRQLKCLSVHISRVLCILSFPTFGHPIKAPGAETHAPMPGRIASDNRGTLGQRSRIVR